MAIAANEVIYWLDKFDLDIEGYLSAERKSIDDLKKSLNVYRRAGII